MNRKIAKKVALLLIVGTTLFQEKINAGGGKSFGLFAGGAVAGGLIGSAIAKRNRPSAQPVVVQERIIERPVYVQQPGQSFSTTTTSDQEAAQLKERLYEQDERIRKLEQELRAERREAQKLR